MELAHFTAEKDGTFELNAFANFSRLLDAQGMNVSFWWPLALFTANLTSTEAVLRSMPRVDSVFFPGGDGGALVWPDIATAASLLTRVHPSASVWVSAQELSRADLRAFTAKISTAEVRAFLGGVVYGPHVEVPLTEFVQAVVPAGYPVRQYPDICHSLSAQFPVPRWHEAFKASHGRQAINPMARFAANIVRLRSNGSTPTAGVGAYSEGVHDDLNKCVWSAMAEDARLTVEEAVAQYARYFFGRHAGAMAAALLQLEANWQGDILAGAEGIAATLQRLEAVEAAASAGELATNWRLQSLLYRGYYDAITQVRYGEEAEARRAAHGALADAPMTGSLAAIDEALAILAAANGTAARGRLVAGWRAHALQLVEDINRSVGVEVLQSQNPSLGVAGLFADLAGLGWLRSQLRGVAAVSGEAARLAMLQSLVNWTAPGPGGFYDDLGHVGGAGGEARLLPGEGPQSDPSYYHTPLAAYRDDPRVRQAWRTYAHSFYDGAVTLDYKGLDANRR